MSTGGTLPSTGAGVGAVGSGGGHRSKLVPQVSTVWTRKQNAVCVRRACKTYGSKKAKHVILDNLNMTVPKGSIYGLLGASGCGKTTLLSCIVGRRRLNSGEIWVLGGTPCSRGSGVPGPRIGYMPQEIALYGEFTIRESLKYFGWIAGMKTKDIMEKMDSLLELLQLPFPDRKIKNLSGGQQRRVSMAATFLHEPELLILDEPTVGVDPVLRQKIWDYMVEITADKTTTIIITTHYIDETKQATTIGLMRGGKFLAEESPDELLSRYNSESLEDAFLKLAVLQNKGKRRRSSISSNIIAATTPTIPELQDMGIMNEGFDTQSEISGEFGENMSVNNFKAISQSDSVDPVPPVEDVQQTWKDYFDVYTSHHMKALVWKNVLYMWRNIGVLLWILGMPVLEVVTFSLAIGHDPVGLHLAVVNQEFPGNCQYNASCEAIHSCRYLHHLGQMNHKLVNYDNVEEAEFAVKKGWAWGMLRIPPEFTENVNSRIELGINTNDSSIEGGEIDVRLDMSNQQIGFMLKRDIILTLENFAAAAANSCGIPTKAISLPLRMNDPIYGPRVPNFTDFAAPGVMLTIVFFLSVALTSGTMLVERNEGILERCLVSGITGLEILSSHVITQFIVMLGQAFCVVGFALYVFDITNEGSVVWIMVLMVMCGTCGMAYGFVVSCVCDSERNATYLALGSFLPFVMLCGIIWPVEGMHKILRTIAFFLPLTLSTESLRSMLARGWDLHRPTVYSGFISTGAWILIYMLASVLLLKFKKG